MQKRDQLGNHEPCKEFVLGFHDFDNILHLLHFVNVQLTHERLQELPSLCVWCVQLRTRDFDVVHVDFPQNQLFFMKVG